RVGDVKRVLPQLADDERRGIDHVVDVLELFRPVDARAPPRGERVPAPHAHHRIARTQVRLEFARRPQLVDHHSSTIAGAGASSSPGAYGGRSRVSRRGTPYGPSWPIRSRRLTVLNASE